MVYESKAGALGLHQLRFKHYQNLNQAARDGKIYYQQLLSSLGFEDVQVIVVRKNQTILV